MYSYINTAVIIGIEPVPVRVEADVSDGMPQFDMVGYLSGEVKEARERVRTALSNSGYRLPPKKITINLTPANIRKSGNGCDLPVAAAILCAMGHLDQKLLAGYLVLGEIGLDGRILPVRGTLNSAVLASRQGMRGIILPAGNAKEASLLQKIPVFPVSSLTDFIDLCRAGIPDSEAVKPEKGKSAAEYPVDFSEINGQKSARLAAEIAAAGMHNMLLIGPPGAGKTMLAKRMPTILPELSPEEKLEVTKIYSVYGMLKEDAYLHNERPFRSPHHTITGQAMAGGGNIPRPGEISLAHRGVLYLDELPEYDHHVLEILREPLEDHQICISRVDQNVTYPANFLLLASMNPCKCGYYPDLNRCICSPASIRRYISRVSRPLLERMDLCVQMTEVSYHDLWETGGNESSASIRTRVNAVWEIQKQRFHDYPFFFNSQIPSAEAMELCLPVPEIRKMAEESFDKQQMSARSFYKLLRVSRTIADMEQSDMVTPVHFQKALLFRGLDQSFWKVV